MDRVLRTVLSALISCSFAALVACSEDDPAGGAGASGAASGGMTGGSSGVGGASGGGAGGASGTTSGAGGTAGAAGTNSTGGSGGAGAAGAGGAGGMATGGTNSTGGMMSGGDGGDSGDSGTPDDLDPFSFFLTSYEAMVRLSGSENGFGGDLRYGEDDGLSGADKICTEVAEYSMPGAGAKGWRAFLSVAQGPDGNRVDAIDRIGDGPWFDRLGRTVAETTEALQNTRPEGADDLIYNDLPNEYGVPNHRPDPTGPEIDNHHVLTGSGEDGRLYQNSVDATCDNWTALEDAGRPRIGFSFIEGGRTHWISGQDEGGCGAGFDLDGGGGSTTDNPIVGSGGGYGAIYCFALQP